jgi:undecaprenyl-diphosphatase
MTILNAIILGIIQGLTEFLPISSSGHLIIARQYLGIQTMDGLAFDAVLQLATILAVGLYFWRDIWGLARSFFKLITRKTLVGKESTLFWAIFVGTIPAVIFGLLFESSMDTIFRNIHLVALTLVLGSILMFFAERYAKHNKTLTVEKGLLAGLFQALALLPGVSRSGATISGGLFLGFTREEATRFSFLLSFPIILGSGLKKLLDLYQAHELVVLGPSLWVSSFFAFVVGLAAIHFLITYLKKHTMYVFVVYRLLLVVVLLALF